MEIWEKHAPDYIPEGDIGEIKTDETVYYAELVIYVIYRQKEQGTDRYPADYDVSESSKYADHHTTDPDEFVPEQFQVDADEIDFENPFGITDSDKGIGDFGDCPITPSEKFMTVSMESCIDCDGTQLYCAKCDDTGDIDCTNPDCRDGTIKISCDACSGIGTRDKKCENCGGSGTRKERCTQCDGSGEYLSTTGNTSLRNCRKCDRDGFMEVDCDTCSGGQAPTGQLRVTCEACSGAGSTTHGECSTCNQHATTPAGRVPCPNCDAGTSPPDCQTCHASGQETVVRWAEQEYNVTVQWIRTQGASTTRNELSLRECKRYRSPPTLKSSEEDKNYRPVEARSFSSDAVSVTTTPVAYHPDRKHVTGIRSGNRAAAGEDFVDGGPPWILYEITSEDDSVEGSTHVRLNAHGGDDTDRLRWESYIGDFPNSQKDDDVILPPEDLFVRGYYQMRTAKTVRINYHLPELHEKHEKIRQGRGKIFYPGVTLHETDNGEYEVGPKGFSTVDQLEEAYSSSGFLDKLSGYFT